MCVCVYMIIYRIFNYDTVYLMLQMYTVEGVPVKRQRRSKTSSTEKSSSGALELTSLWQCVLYDKWIIGVELHNRSCW